MDHVTEMLQQQVDLGALPGAVALRLRRGDTDAEVVGVQDLESGTPMSRRTLFHWDSLGKPLTAALALTFVAEGSIDLSAPINCWLPELSDPRVLTDSSGPLSDTVPADRPVTVQDLLTLRGGLGLTTDFESPFTEELVSHLQEGPAPRTLDRQSFLAAAAQLPLAHQPGRGWTYNTGSTLLGLLLERVADQPLDELMAQRIFDPLNMTDTRWWVPAADLDRFASRYAPTGDPEAPLRLVDPPDGQYSRPPSFPDGAGGTIGTADDWLVFATMLLNAGEYRGRRILPTPLVESMMTDQLTADQRRQAGFFLADDEGWGYGGSVRTDGSYGWTGGAGTTARVNPRHGSASILFTQVALDGPEGSPVLTAFEDLVAQDQQHDPNTN
ncbi:serine hydrolase [Kocuria indica]|uniref:Serine hydrolase n=1 Tax=Kocuria marina subsp. indica TaxID=1049583 RepID=A0A6N9R097_9MICC|nr:serine hydrolase domain-containing protein [Kocuria indica]NDO78935.1 serine hydrolase [Kocuria indica]